MWLLHSSVAWMKQEKNPLSFDFARKGFVPFPFCWEQPLFFLPRQNQRFFSLGFAWKGWGCVTPSREWQADNQTSFNTALSCCYTANKKTIEVESATKTVAPLSVQLPSQALEASNPCPWGQTAAAAKRAQGHGCSPHTCQAVSSPRKAEKWWSKTSPLCSPGCKHTLTCSHSSFPYPALICQ